MYVSGFISALNIPYSRYFWNYRKKRVFQKPYNALTSSGKSSIIWSTSLSVFCWSILSRICCIIFSSLRLICYFLFLRYFLYLSTANQSLRQSYIQVHLKTCFSFIREKRALIHTHTHSPPIFSRLVVKNTTLFPSLTVFHGSAIEWLFFTTFLKASSFLSFSHL